jgi:hypothetical protein
MLSTYLSACAIRGRDANKVFFDLLFGSEAVPLTRIYAMTASPSDGQ